MFSVKNLASAVSRLVFVWSSVLSEKKLGSRLCSFVLLQVWPGGVNKTLPEQPPPEIAPGITERDGSLEVQLHDIDLPAGVQVRQEQV